MKHTLLKSSASHAIVKIPFGNSSSTLCRSFIARHPFTVRISYSGSGRGCVWLTFIKDVSHAVCPFLMSHARDPMHVGRKSGRPPDDNKDALLMLWKSICLVTSHFPLRCLDMIKGSCCVCQQKPSIDSF